MLSYTGILQCPAQAGAWVPVLTSVLGQQDLRALGMAQPSRTLPLARAGVLLPSLCPGGQSTPAASENVSPGQKLRTSGLGVKCSLIVLCGRADGRARGPAVRLSHALLALQRWGN